MSLVCYSLYFTDFVGEAVFGGDPGVRERKFLVLFCWWFCVWWSLVQFIDREKEKTGCDMYDMIWSYIYRYGRHGCCRIGVNEDEKKRKSHYKTRKWYFCFNIIKITQFWWGCQNVNGISCTILHLAQYNPLTSSKIYQAPSLLFRIIPFINLTGGSSTESHLLISKTVKKK